MSARSINSLTDLSQTIGAASVVVVSAALLNEAQPSSLPLTQVRANCIILHNCHATNTVAFNLTGGTAVINGQGCITLNPLGMIILDTAVPQNNITAIASAASTPITVQVML